MATCVKILGAGSIGNHMSHASSKLGWNVTLCDTNFEALQRAKTEIYPNRYGQWNEDIKLARPEEVKDQLFDLTIIGTPPESHLSLALEEIENNSSKRILIEKPLCGFTDELLNNQKLIENSNQIYVGYNHNVSASAQFFFSQLSKVGNVFRIDTNVLESTRFILNAHSWLPDINHSYLSEINKGGGALHEHSHGVAFALALLNKLNIKTSFKLQSNIIMDSSKKYDLRSFVSMCSQEGLTINITQDFTSLSPIKKTTVYGEKGQLTWSIPHQKNCDLVEINSDEFKESKSFKKERSSDFVTELELIQNSDVPPYELSLQLGRDVMSVIRAAIQENKGESYEFTL